MNDIYTVHISRLALKSLKRMPFHIALKLHAWIDEVINRGLFETRKIHGYHDEPLVGNRIGQRSIKLNRSYRAVYIIDAANRIKFVEILEITKHGY